MMIPGKKEKLATKSIRVDPDQWNVFMGIARMAGHGQPEAISEALTLYINHMAERKNVKQYITGHAQAQEAQSNT